METENLFCEVIGCGARATWELITEGDPLREEFLCDRHWNELRARIPDYSLCYVLLETASEAPAEPPDVATGETSIPSVSETPIRPSRREKQPAS